MTRKEEKKSVLIRFDEIELHLLDTMSKQDLRDRTNFIRLLIRQEAERRKIKLPKEPKG